MYAGLIQRGGALSKPGGGRCAHSVHLHERAETILPSQLFTIVQSYKVTATFLHTVSYTTICVVHNVFKLIQAFGSPVVMLYCLM